ncbi:hypothetical protein GT003_05125 [Paenibacillus sacheonensis]|uniref:PA14 domain-containing protein n=2 Tax=Paenibacillus sacheonensis TaxID=742054 RepID=A0A7X4YMM6_9BACL|nr:hypothetical protein [Paenibacillus sacheonensis]
MCSTNQFGDPAPGYYKTCEVNLAGGTGDTQAPSAPSNLTSPSKTTTSVNLSWTASTDNVAVTGYNIYNGSTLAGTVASGTTFSVTGLTANTAYTFTVKAKDAAGNVSAASNALSVTTSSASDTQAPTAPSSLTSPSKTATSVNLSWTASTDNVGVTGYDVYNGSTLAGTTAGTTFTVSGLSASTAYTFTVKAKDAAGNVSSASNALSVTTNASSDTQAPTAPSSLTSPSKTATSVNLSWTASTDNVGVTGYDVYNGSTLAGTTAGTTFTVSGLTASTAYTFSVKAKDAAGNVSSASNALSVTTSAASGGSGSVTREYWTGVSGTSVSTIPTGTTPSGTDTLTSLEGPTNWADNYGDRIRGYITPTTSGSYTFYIAGDDESQFYLSTNNSPSNKSMIAYEYEYAGVREWTKHTNQQSASITLTAGQPYYFEILHKEGGGGDNLAVGWTGPGISTITVIGGSYLSAY